ncbi:MAG: fused MFS/spermidine synthase [Pseudomonadota bacterium]
MSAPTTTARTEAETPFTEAGPAGRALPFAAVLLLFWLSGAAALVDQVCFSKYLGYVVGSTAHAVSAVLAAFMTGLALGAALAGRFAARVQRPLAAYAVLELVVAATVALSPLAFRALTPLYSSLARALPDSLAVLSAVRWLLSLCIVVVPTAAMGATLPLLSRGIEGDALGHAETRERRVAALYAANTLGGAVGALVGAYFVIPELGLDGTLMAAAAASALTGAIALWLARAPREERAAPASGIEPIAEARASVPPRSLIFPSRRDRVLLLALAYASGFLVFAAEVVSTHLLALVIGNSAYAFGLILAAFLTWLAVGARLAQPLRRRFSEAALPLGTTAAAVAGLWTIPLWDDVPRLFASLGDAVTSFAGREAVRAGVAFGMLAVPTALMGLTFPLLLKRVAHYAQLGSWVGRLTAVNTVGAVTGALAMGYLILPALGSQGALIAISLGFAACSLLGLPWAAARLRATTLGGVFAAIVLAIAMPRWDLVELTSGSNVYFEGHEQRHELLSIREDSEGGVTSVTRSNGVLTLYTNGKFQGNTGWEMDAQRFFAHYPSLFVSRFDRALVIGLGTGTTLGTLAAYPWKHLDVAEISPAIVEAADRYFRSANGGVLHDPRVLLHIADGRNFLLVEDRQYDLISMELSSIWFAGASSLYTREFYDLVRARLAPDGIFQQWMQLHHVYRRDFATVVNTLREGFPHVALFYGGGQGILVASRKPLAASRARLESLGARPEIQRTLPGGRPLESLIEDVLALDAGLDAFLAESAREAGVPREALIATDENLYLEYRTPRGNVLPWATRDRLVAQIRRFRDEAAIARLLTP